MDHRDVRLQIERLCVIAIDLKVRVVHIARDLLRHALQRVVKTFGDGKEFLVSVDQAPICLNTECEIHGDHPTQQFCHSTAGSGGI